MYGIILSLKIPVLVQLKPRVEKGKQGLKYLAVWVTEKFSQVESNEFLIIKEITVLILFVYASLKKIR